MRRKIKERECNIENYNGSLTHQTDDYMRSFDSKIVEMNRLLSQDREHWEA